MCDVGGKVQRRRRRGECFNTCGFVASRRAADLGKKDPSSALGGSCASVSTAQPREKKKHRCKYPKKKYNKKCYQSYLVCVGSTDAKAGPRV